MTYLESVSNVMSEHPSKEIYTANISDATPVRVRVNEEKNTYEFFCGCSTPTECLHMEDVQGQRKDAPLFTDPGLWIVKKPLYMGIPILVAPIILYWVQLEALDDEPGFIVVKHPHATWNQSVAGTAKYKSIIRTISALVDAKATFEDELCMITEGEGTGDITSSLYDAFGAFHMQYAPPYQCTQRWHKADNERATQERIKNPETKGKELTRLFFTNSCTACAKPASPMDFTDLIPRAHSTTASASPFSTRSAGNLSISPGGDSSHRDHVHISGDITKTGGSRLPPDAKFTGSRWGRR